MLISDVLNVIEGWWEGLVSSSNPCDGLKWGDAAAECTGIMVCWQATSEILQEAADNKLNLVLTHEEPLWKPSGVSYCNVPEIPTEDKPGNLPRLKVCREAKLVLYRSHDALDVWPEHGIGDQWIKFLGFPPAQPGHPVSKIVELSDELSVRDLAGKICEKHGLSYVQTAGDNERLVKRLGILVGAFSWVPTIDILCRILHRQKPDVVIVGEIREPDGLQYLYELDLPCIMVGHAATEEPGLEHFAKYLKQNFTTLPIIYRRTNDPRKAILAPHFAKR